MATPAHDDRARLMPALTLLDLATTLMERAETETAVSPRRRALLFRDGLMIAMLCAWAPRARNFATSAARHSGTCTSRRGIGREVLENVVLEALKRHLLASEYVEEFIRAFHLELNRQRLDSEITAGMNRKQLEEVQRQLDRLIDAIADGLRGPGLQARFDQLEDRKSALEQQLNGVQPSPPRFNPRLAEIYRNKVATLHTALADPQEQDQALEILRGLIDKVVVSPSKNDRSFEIELVGEIANMVALLPGAETAEREP